MRPEHLTELRNKNLITHLQYDHLEPIITKKIIPVYYELRIVLYLGVLLFTTGAGILIYKNIGDIGHLISIIVLFALTAVCLWYAFKLAKPYSNEKITPPTPYYDYIVLLGCLLFISVLGYLQIQYELFDDGMGTTTLVTAAFFFYAAYRFDHLGILSLAIAALASFWSISVSPQKWYSGNFFDEGNVHITAIFFGAVLCAIALALDKKEIKKHFTFTYLNFGSLIFLIGSMAGIFINENGYGLFLLSLLSGCFFLASYAHQKKSFLFILYAFVFGYIGITYFLTDVILDDIVIWFFYLIASCGGFIYFIVRYKSYFKRAE